MSNNIIAQYDGTDEEKKLDIPSIKLNTGTIEQAPEASGMADFSSAISAPSAIAETTPIEAPYQIEQQDTSTIDFGKTVADVAKQRQQEFLGAQQQQLGTLGSQLETANHLANYYPTLFEGPSSLDLARGGHKVDAMYDQMIRSSQSVSHQPDLDLMNLSKLPQNRTSQEQFRPDSTADAFKGFLMASGIGNLLGGLGEKPGGVNVFKGEYGDYGRGNLAAAMYALNLPFQAVWGGVNDIVNQRNKFVDWIGTHGPIGAGTKAVLNWNPLTAIDQFVNRNVPDHKPLSLFHDNNTNDSDFMNALRGKAPQSFSNYRDEANSFIGVRMQKSYNPLKWHSDPSFWAGMAMDVLLDPADLLFGPAIKAGQKALRKTPVAKGGNKALKEFAEATVKDVGTQAISRSRQIAEGLYIPPPLSKVDFPKEPLRAPGLKTPVKKVNLPPEPLAIPVQELPDFMYKMEDLVPKVPLPDLKAKPKIPPKYERLPNLEMPSPLAGQAMPELGKPIDLLPKPRAARSVKPPNAPVLGELQPKQQLIQPGQALPDLTKKVDVPLGDKLTELKDKPLPTLTDKLGSPLDELKPKQPLIDGQTAIPDLSKPISSQIGEPLPSLGMKPLPKLAPKVVPARVFSAELSLSELADRLTKAPAGIQINPTVLNKQKRKLADLVELGKHIPGPDGYPLVPKDAGPKHFKTWKQLNELVASLPDPAYQRLFSQQGPPIPIDDLVNGNFVIKLSDGSMLTPPVTKADEVPVSQVFDLTKVDPKFASSTGTPNNPTLIDQAKQVKTLAQEVLSDTSKSVKAKRKARQVINEANGVLHSPDVVEEVPPHLLSQQELKQRFLNAANNAPRPGLEKPKPHERFVVKVKPNDDAVKTYQRQILPSEQHTPDINQLQDFVETRRAVTNVSEEVRTNSLELRTLKELHAGVVDDMVKNTPDIGRQLIDPIESPALPNQVAQIADDLNIEDIVSPGGVKVANPDGTTTVTLYHGSRIQHTDFNFDPALGGTRSELGTLHHFTDQQDKALEYALARIAHDLPPLEGRAVGTPTLYKTTVTIDKSFIKFTDAPSQMWINAWENVAGRVFDKNNALHRQAYNIYQKMNGKVRNYTDLFHHFDVAVAKAFGKDNFPVELAEQFQRKVTQMLQSRGVNGFFGELADGSMQVSFTNGKRIKEITQGQLSTSLIDDVESAIAHRLNADSYAASMHPDSLLNKVKFGETKAGLLAQLIERSDNTLQQSIEEQTKLVADFFTKQKALEVNGKAVKQKMMDDVLASIDHTNTKVMQQLDHPIKNPCDL